MKNIILDTDIGNDCDDAGAISLLLNCEKKYDFNVLGIASCTSKKYGGNAIQSILNDYGKSVPIGALNDGFNEKEDYYCYLFKDTDAIVDDYIKFYRKLLLKNTDITIIAIGPLYGLNKLLTSEGDDISPLSGRELFSKSVKKVYAMCGMLENDTEWNVSLAIKDTINFFDNCPVPIVVCPFEEGYGVLTGKNFRDTTATGKIYKKFSPENGLRDSWDLITVYCAIGGENCRVLPCNIKFENNGRMIVEKGCKNGIVKAGKDIASHIDNLTL